jgi:hypothetical protein
MSSAAARFCPSTRCPYTSLVMATLEWPSTSETTYRSVPLGQHQRGTGVPQLVQMPVPEAGPPADPGEQVGDVVRVERCADLAREDQPVVLPCLTDRHPLGRLTSPVPTQHLNHLRRQEQRPARSGRLELTDHQLCA